MVVKISIKLELSKMRMNPPKDSVMLNLKMKMPQQQLLLFTDLNSLEEILESTTIPKNQKADVVVVSAVEVETEDLEVEVVVETEADSVEEVVVETEVDSAEEVVAEIEVDLAEEEVTEVDVVALEAGEVTTQASAEKK